MTVTRPPLAKRIDHVGLVVRNIDESITFYVDVLGLTVSADVSLGDGSARLAYLESGDTTLQLVQPLRQGPLTDFLDAHGEGLHHVCFAVGDVIEALRALPDVEPEDGVYVGGRGCRVSFVRSRPNGLLLELTELEPSAPADPNEVVDAMRSVSPRA
jgi:methylmalonyl-CoA/ethylmalonyl-CoA epimerase